ncbi:Quinol monooxygenase YgiN [Haloplanus vescus]|uniref:Quinol monooxygenase YgiN n=1 Tax=Haloplanus vescus TaxID=555874 RepID=A0A1H3YE01_9EURY|nr:putative quinol monooxygenase [Haloplanus vescus]SEA09827.1 Quinol monooxygenase YgiN [Haloplanus vescus]
MLVVHATIPVDPAHRDRAVELMRTLAVESRAEEGVIDYRVTTDIEDENVFRIVERYEDEAAFGAHVETEHFGEFEAALPELLDGEPTITRFDVENATDVEL